MDEEAFNISIRKFLKLVGVSSQREIEQAVRNAIADGTVAGGTSGLPVKMTLELPALGLSSVYEGTIDVG